jgi:hypothetical protein
MSTGVYSLGMRRLVWVVGLAAVALVGGGCGLDKPKPTPADDGPRVSADELGDAFEDTSASDYLAPAEREALERVGAADAEPRAIEPRKADEPHGFFSRVSDTAGKLGVALLSVGMTIGMAVAPFLLF